MWSDDGEGEPAVRLLGIDYHYCKGCLKCVDACPTGSLTELREEDGWAEEHRVPLFPWLERCKEGRPMTTAPPQAGGSARRRARSSGSAPATRWPRCRRSRSTST